MLLPPDLREWLPENHLVHFILEVGSDLAVAGFSGQCPGHGQCPVSTVHAVEPVDLLL